MGSGIYLMHEAVTTNHHPNDGHIANAAAATELSIEIGNPRSYQWAEELGTLVQQRLEELPSDPTCKRLFDMNIPKTKAIWNKMSNKALLTSILAVLCVFMVAGRTSAQGNPIDLQTDPIGVPKDNVNDENDVDVNPFAAEGSRTRPTPTGALLAVPKDPTTKKICNDAKSKGEICMRVDGVALPGDSNLDGFFDSNDLTLAMVSGEFEDLVPRNSNWTDGDWNLDGEFDTTDIRLAFEANRFVQVSSTRSMSLVPEPSSTVLITLGILVLLGRRRK
jgi:hypothetical protein